MKSIFSLSIIVLCFYGCAPSLKIASFDPNSGIACKNPSFVKTMTKITTNGGLDLSLYQLTKDAQASVGADVSIQNVHWDVLGGKKISVVYDIIRCNGDSLGRN